MKTRKIVSRVLMILTLIGLLGVVATVPAAQAQGPYCDPPGPVGTYGAICYNPGSGFYCIIDEAVKICGRTLPSSQNFLCVPEEREVTVDYHVESREGKGIEKIQVTFASGMQRTDVGGNYELLDASLNDAACDQTFPYTPPYCWYQPQTPGTSDAIVYEDSAPYQSTLDAEYTMRLVAAEDKYTNGNLIFNDQLGTTFLFGDGTFHHYGFPLFGPGPGLKVGPWVGQYSFNRCIFLPLIVK